MIASHYVGNDLRARSDYCNATLSKVHVDRVVQKCSYCVSDERGKENKSDDCVVDIIIYFKLEDKSVEMDTI
jgi:hypothetical protein